MSHTGDIKQEKTHYLKGTDYEESKQKPGIVGGSGDYDGAGDRSGKP
jgi:hypothetical protein